jgi:hypothetical protein
MKASDHFIDALDFDFICQEQNTPTDDAVGGRVLFSSKIVYRNSQLSQLAAIAAIATRSYRNS